MWPMKAKTTLVSFHKEVLYTVYQFVSGYCNSGVQKHQKIISQFFSRVCSECNDIMTGYHWNIVNMVVIDKKSEIVVKSLLLLFHHF